MQQVFRVLSVASLASTAACQSSVPVPPFPDFGPAARVVVTGRGGGDTLAVLSAPADSARIAALVRFANVRNSGWARPWYGVPVPRVTVLFFGTEFQGSFGAGPNFFETQRSGDFASRAATPTEISEFTRLLGIPIETVTGESR